MCKEEHPGAYARERRTEDDSVLIFGGNEDFRRLAWLSAKGQVVHDLCAETGKHLSIRLDFLQGERANPLFKRELGLLNSQQTTSRHMLTSTF